MKVIKPLATVSFEPPPRPHHIRMFNPNHPPGFEQQVDELERLLQVRGALRPLDGAQVRACTRGRHLPVSSVSSSDLI